MKEIKLTQGKMAIVDDDIWDFLSQYKWCAVRFRDTYYAVKNVWFGNKKSRSAYLHHVIVGRPINGFKVDHINGNSLDNRRQNLRIVTNRENIINSRRFREGRTSSRYPGVSWHKTEKTWRASIQINGRQVHLGHYQNELDAANAYKAAFKKLPTLSHRTHLNYSHSA